MSRLILTKTQEAPTWMTQSQVDDLPRLKTEGLIQGFMDITDHPIQHPPKNALLSYPNEPSRPQEVAELVEHADVGRMATWWEELTLFHNRYYIGQYGKESAQYIHDTAQAAVDESGRDDVSVFFHVTGFDQDNVVVRVEGTRSEEVLVFGAHQDSINGRVPIEDRPQAQAGGADDDGSGSAAVFEMMRAVLDANYRPERALEFQWYAAEEVGLLGSQMLAEDMRDQGQDVYAMLNSDMCGGRGGMNMISDFTDDNLNHFATLLIDDYVDLPWANASHGYASSDHASFGRAGYPAVFPFEMQGPHPDRGDCTGHTEHDVFECVDPDFTMGWVKLGLSMVVELSPL